MKRDNLDRQQVAILENLSGKVSNSDGGCVTIKKSFFTRFVAIMSVLYYCTHLTFYILFFKAENYTFECWDFVQTATSTSWKTSLPFWLLKCTWCEWTCCVPDAAVPPEDPRCRSLGGKGRTFCGPGGRDVLITKKSQEGSSPIAIKSNFWLSIFYIK